MFPLVRVLPRRPFELREVEDLPVAEDELSAVVLLRQSVKIGGALGGGEDVIPRHASCLDNVLGGLPSDNNVGLVVARGFLVRLKVVFFLFRAVPFPEVVARTGEVDGGVLDRANVGAAPSEVENIEWSLEAGGENDNGVIVNAEVLVLFLAELEPVGGVEGMEEVGEFIGVDIRGLGPREKVTLRVGTEGHAV